MTTSKGWTLIETGIYHNPHTARYRIRGYALTPQTGKVGDRQKTLPPGSTIEEARAALHALTHQIRSPEAAKPTPQRLTLQAYAQRWLAGQGDRLAPGTIKKHIDALAHHILPQIGDLYCDALTRAHVQVWVDEAVGKTLPDGRPYGRGSVLTWWRILQALLRDMQADLHLPFDATDRVKMPQLKRAPRKERQTLTRAQFETLIAACERDHQGQQVLVMALTGMRPGEMLGLQWGDIDQADEALHLRRSSSLGGVTDGGKTGQGRVIYMHPLIAAGWQSHRVAWTSEQERVPGPHDWVFPTAYGARRTSGSLRNLMERMTQVCRLEFGLTPSVLRRTFNTLMVQAQVDALVLRSQMGHSGEAMTAHYTHVAQDQRRHAVLTALAPSRLGTSLGTSSHDSGDRDTGLADTKKDGPHG